jgi:hypothetical protein
VCHVDSVQYIIDPSSVGCCTKLECRCQSTSDPPRHVQSPSSPHPPSLPNSLVSSSIMASSPDACPLSIHYLTTQAQRAETPARLKLERCWPPRLYADLARGSKGIKIVVHHYSSYKSIESSYADG